MAGDETGDDTYVLTVVDTGEEVASGSPVEVTDTLPSGLVASAISGEDMGNGQALSCGLTPKLGCSYEGFDVSPGDVLQIDIRVKVSSEVGATVVNSATETGGGAESSVTSEDSTKIGPTPAKLGISDFATTWSGTQAGASVNLTTGFTFNQLINKGETIPAAYTKEVALNLPPGFIANPEAVPQCSISEAVDDACPASSAVGVAFTSSSSGVGAGPVPYSSLLYNTTPSPGELGALTMFLPSGPVSLSLTLQADGEAGLRIAISDLPEINALTSATLTLWGVPAIYNGAGPDHTIADTDSSFGAPGATRPQRFLTSAGTCDALSDSTLSADTWTTPGVFTEASFATPALTGCDGLSFEPSLTIAPDETETDEPSGYELDLNMPQPEGAEGLASAELENAAVALPEGADISLPASDGMLACTEAQVGLGSSSESTCPEASKVGTVEIQASLFAHPLQGAVYFATPSENPFGSALALYIVAGEAWAGVSLKLTGEIESNPLTGRLTIVLRELPQLPISALRLHFFGGERALLSTPAVCGAAVSTSALTAWSATSDATPSSSFDIELGIDGTSCSKPLPFSPSFQAGSASESEDTYNSLTLIISRTDHEQEFSTIAIQAPPAVAQMFAGVPSCGEPQASEGNCATASEVGSVAAQAGLGPDPADLYGGIYLTGSYDGAAQGLSIVLPVNPGPFELGNAIVRASVQIDPITGQLSITSARLPSFVDGVPLHLDALLLQLDRGEFEINPVGCESLVVTGTITSTQGSAVASSAEPLGAASSSCPPAQAPSSKESGVSPETGRVSLLATPLMANGHGFATVQLACVGTGTCRGKLTLMAGMKRDGKKRSKTIVIGARGFSIPAGRTATVKFALTSHGRSLLSAGHGRLNATLSIVKSSPVPAQTQSVKVRILRT